MEFKEFWKQKERVCKTESGWCVNENCPLSGLKKKYECACMKAIIDHPDEAEAIVQKWADEHPIVTNRMKFKEVFGNIYLQQSEEFWKDEYKEPEKEVKS